MVIQEKACKLLWPAAHVFPGSLSCPWQKENLLNVLSSSLLYLLTSSTSVLPSWAVYIGKSVPLFWRKFYRWSFLCVFVACECFAAVRLTRNDVFSCNFDAQKIYASANSGHGLWAGWGPALGSSGVVHQGNGSAAPFSEAQPNSSVVLWSWAVLLTECVCTLLHDQKLTCRSGFAATWDNLLRTLWPLCWLLVTDFSNVWV